MATLFRRSVQVAARTARRNFGSHAPVEYTGAEASLRKVLPQDHQVVIAFLSSYAVLIALSRAGGSDEPAPAKAVAAPVAASNDGAIPSIADANFDEWIKVKFIDSVCVVHVCVALVGFCVDSFVR